ncbi:MAG: acyltransferase, partial [Patescibacteria group bacterium]
NNSPYELEYKAFAKFIRGENIPLGSLVVLILKSFVAIFEMSIRYIPGGIGYTLRYWYYKCTLKHLGKNVLIDVGVFLYGLKNISIGEYTWIDSGVRIEAMLGEITIGKRVHIAPYAIVAAREPVIIEDYAAVGAGAKIYANSERPFGGKRMSGPMIPEEYKAFYAKKIVLEKDSCVGTGAVLLPGAYICEGAVVGANTVVKKKVEPYDIVAGSPPRVIGKREKISVPDL